MKINTAPRGLLFDLTDLSMAEWQRRTLADLNKQIELRRLALRNGVTGTTADVESKDRPLHELLLRKAMVLGRGPEFRELTALRNLTSADPEKYAKARTSIAALEKTLTDAESALTPPAPSAKTDDPVIAALALNPQCAIVNETFLRAAMNTQGIPGRPQYIVVMQPAGVKVSDLKVAHSACDSIVQANDQKTKPTDGAAVPTGEVPKP